MLEAKRHITENRPADNSKKTKILFIIDLLRGFAGTEKHLYDTVANLNRDIFTCTIISFDTRELIIEEFKKIGITVIELPLRKIYGLQALRQLFSLIKHIKNLNPDIIQTFHFKADTFAVMAAKMAGVSIVVSSRRDIGDTKKSQHIFMNRIMNRFIDRFIAVCNAASAVLQDKEKVPSRRIQVIYNGVDTERFAPDSREALNARREMGIADDTFVVGIISNFRPEKDIFTFFKSMVIVNNEIGKLKIIASGCGSAPAQKKIGEQVVRFCKENNLSSKTILPGYAKNVRPYIACMDVACLTPVSNEGFSNAILEEMSMGKPVIATDVGGNAESVVDGETGFIIPSGNPEILAEKILYFYRNPEMRKNMGRKARRNIEENLSLQKMIKEMQYFYTSLMKR